MCDTLAVYFAFRTLTVAENFNGRCLQRSAITELSRISQFSGKNAIHKKAANINSKIKRPRHSTINEKFLNAAS